MVYDRSVGFFANVVNASNHWLWVKREMVFGGSDITRWVCERAVALFETESFSCWLWRSARHVVEGKWRGVASRSSVLLSHSCKDLSSVNHPNELGKWAQSLGSDPKARVRTQCSWHLDFSLCNCEQSSQLCQAWNLEIRNVCWQPPQVAWSEHHPVQKKGLRFDPQSGNVWEPLINVSLPLSLFLFSFLSKINKHILGWGNK